MALWHCVRVARDTPLPLPLTSAYELLSRLEVKELFEHGYYSYMVRPMAPLRATLCTHARSAVASSVRT